MDTVEMSSSRDVEMMQPQLQQGPFTIEMVKAALSEQETRLRAEFAQQIASLEERLTAQITQSLQSKAGVAHGPPAKAPPAPRQAKARRPSKYNCYVCGGSHNVHRHRDLAVHLDDKCRKQVETFKTGGVVTERRVEWQRALAPLQDNKLAQDMQLALEALSEAALAEERLAVSAASNMSNMEVIPSSKKRRLEPDCGDACCEDSFAITPTTRICTETAASAMHTAPTDEDINLMELLDEAPMQCSKLLAEQVLPQDVEDWLSGVEL